MSLAELLRRAALLEPDQLALTAGPRPWTYRELDEVTDRMARSLVRLGIQPGDRVALQRSENARESSAGSQSFFTMSLYRFRNLLTFGPTTAWQ